MRVAVCLKHVPDPATVEVDALTGIIDTGRILYITNPADEVALELALRLCSPSGTVSVLTVGPVPAESVLRGALAVGAHSATRIWDSALSETSSYATATLLAAALRLQGLPDLVLCGTRSVDRGSGQVPALLAETLGWPVVTDVTSLVIDGQGARVQQRLARGAREQSAVQLPAVLALEPGLVRLRQASMPGLMQAKRATIPIYHLAALGLAPGDLRFPSPTLRAVSPPRPRARATFIPDSSRPHYERIDQILSAGVTSKSGQMIEGPPEAMAEAIISFLREHGFLAEAQ